MKDKRSNCYKTAAWILLIAGIVSFSVINIFSLFFHYSNRIHNEILNRNMEQISLSSDYIVKIIRSEMRHCTEILNIGEENFSVPEKMTSGNSTIIAPSFGSDETVGSGENVTISPIGPGYEPKTRPQWENSGPGVRQN